MAEARKSTTYESVPSISRYSGSFPETYDRYRPRPPVELVDLLSLLSQSTRPRLVVDLGSGTGLSTRVWHGRADRVIGVEPNPDMRRVAERAATALQPPALLEYRAGLSTDTGLPDACADVVTCSQSFHWMEPVGTLAEVARILRSGGVFAAYDYDWPPTIQWQVEVAFRSLHRRLKELEAAHGIREELSNWPKQQHLERMRASGHFRFVNEIFLHHVEHGDTERLLGLAMSHASAAVLRARGVDDATIGLDQLAATAREILGDAIVPWYYGYRIRIGIK
jgi:SAM-dependent methyltransferase